jgi:hypothetical protein
LDSPKWEKTVREDAFLIPKAHKILQKRVVSGKSKGAIRLFGQPLDGYNRVFAVLDAKFELTVFFLSKICSNFAIDRILLLVEDRGFVARRAAISKFGGTEHLREFGSLRSSVFM